MSTDPESGAQLFQYLVGSVCVLGGGTNSGCAGDEVESAPYASQAEEVLERPYQGEGHAGGVAIEGVRPTPSSPSLSPSSPNPTTAPSATRGESIAILVLRPESH